MAKQITASQAWTGVADCKNCSIRHAVLFAGLHEADFDEFHRPIDQLQFPAGATLYNAGDDATAMFTIRAGLVKLTQYLPDGSERIVRLMRKTDLVGLEAMTAPAYDHTAIALQATEVCRLPVDLVKRFSAIRPALFHEIMARWHHDLARADRWITDFSTGPARDRVVRLLLWLAEPGGEERCDLFSREEMGAVLGLTTETVSRIMADLKRQGYVSEPRLNHILCDGPNLRRLVAA